MVPRRSPISLLCSVGLAAALVACQTDGAGPTTNSQRSPATASTMSGAASAPLATKAPDPSASAPSSAEPASPWTGTWHGVYDAEKDEVHVQKGVRWGGWAKEPGTTAVGEGRITIEVDPGGEVSGTATGALGDQRVRGVVEGNSLRAGVGPLDEASVDAMRGILTGTAEGDRIEARLQVASPDASLVRRSVVRFERK